MQLQLERTTRTCFTDNCPARFRVLDASGGAVFIGKQLDEETLAQVQDQIGPGETALWVPGELL